MQLECSKESLCKKIYKNHFDKQYNYCQAGCLQATAIIRILHVQSNSLTEEPGTYFVGICSLQFR